MVQSTAAYRVYHAIKFAATFKAALAAAFAAAPEAAPEPAPFAVPAAAPEAAVVELPEVPALVVPPYKSRQYPSQTPASTSPRTFLPPFLPLPPFFPPFFPPAAVVVPFARDTRSAGAESDLTRRQGEAARRSWGSATAAASGLASGMGVASTRATRPSARTAKNFMVLRECAELERTVGIKEWFGSVARLQLNE